MTQALESLLEQFLNASVQIPEFLGRYGLQNLLNRFIERPAARGIDVAAVAGGIRGNRVPAGVFEAAQQLTQARAAKVNLPKLVGEPAPQAHANGHHAMK